MHLPKKPPRHVQWDEDKLSQTEKLRGAFHKISEPKLPNQANSDSDEEHISPQQKSQEEIALDASLEAARQNSRANCQKRLNLAELNARLTKQIGKPNETEHEQHRERSSEESEMKRPQHYDEFKDMQGAKQRKREE